MRSPPHRKEQAIFQRPSGTQRKFQRVFTGRGCNDRARRDELAIEIPRRNRRDLSQFAASHVSTPAVPALDWYATMPDPLSATTPGGARHLSIRRYAAT